MRLMAATLLNGWKSEKPRVHIGGPPRAGLAMAARPRETTLSSQARDFH
jgi:hypothetical protein